MEYDEANRLQTLNEAEWEHDADGNVTVRVVGNETWNLTYDSQGQLTEIQQSGAQNGVEYKYDGLGRRVKTVDNVSSTTREYVYAGSTLIAEKVNGSWVNHTYGLGLAQRGETYQHWDQLGNLSATADGQGSQTAGPVFDAFGNPVAGNPSEYGWNGAYLYRHEANTGGLQQVGVRWYDPAVGRFLQRDPAFSAPVYSYCWNDPVNLVDYFGLKPGEKYKSPDAAAKAALKDVAQKKDSVDVEYGGWIYKNPDGSYSYTRPVRGTEHFVSPPTSDLPEGTTGIGGYHNHIPGFIENEDFSGLDRDFAREYGSVYLLTPTGYIKRYLPGKGDSVIGTLN